VQSSANQSKPTPTTIPTKPAPTKKANAPAVPLTVSNIRVSPTNTVYYGNCAPGDPTLISVEATIQPLDQVKEVLLWFDIFDQTGVVHSDYVSMWQLGIGDYAGDIDIGQIGPNAMVDRDGSISFWIEVVNKENASMHSNAFSLNIWYCPGAVVSQPPLPPPTINYFNVPNSVQAGDWVNTDWEVFDAACGMTLDGNPVDASGFYSYQTSTGDAGKVFTHTLIAAGEPCNNPTEVIETKQVTVNSASTIAKGSGSVKDEFSLDLGDGNGDDVIFDMQSSDTILLAVWGSELAVWYGGPPSVSDCVSYINSGSYTNISIVVDDVVCYKTGSDNYGYLTINGMYIDLDDYSNSYVDISYTTELNP